MEQTRLVHLDALRGLAAVLVLLRHAPHAASSPLSALHQLGWVGVDLFFVLSGFLVGQLLLRELKSTGTIRYGRFLLRRGFKIWPSYFAGYGAVVLAALWLHREEAGAAKARLLEQWPNFLLIQNYFSLGRRWPHSWTLAVEEHFYTALPLLLLALLWLGRGRLRHLGAAAALVAAAALTGRLLLTSGAPDDWIAVYYPTHLRAGGLVFGVWLGQLNLEGRGRIREPVAWCLLGGCLLLPLLWPLESSRAMQTVGFTLLWLGFGAAVLAAARCARTAGPVGAAWAWLGRYSYTAYIAHAMLDMVWHRLPYLGDSAPHALQQLTFIAGSLAGGVLLSHLVERPFLRLRERVVPRRHRVPATGAQMAPAPGAEHDAGSPPAGGLPR